MKRHGIEMTARMLFFGIAFAVLLLFAIWFVASYVQPNAKSLVGMIDIGKTLGGNGG